MRWQSWERKREKIKKKESERARARKKERGRKREWRCVLVHEVAVARKSATISVRCMLLYRSLLISFPDGWERDRSLISSLLIYIDIEIDMNRERMQRRCKLWGIKKRNVRMFEYVIKVRKHTVRACGTDGPPSHRKRRWRVYRN
jgi:hypothetical protein